MPSKGGSDPATASRGTGQAGGMDSAGDQGVGQKKRGASAVRLSVAELNDGKHSSLSELMQSAGRPLRFCCENRPRHPPVAFFYAPNLRNVA